MVKMEVVGAARGQEPEEFRGRGNWIFIIHVKSWIAASSIMGLRGKGKIQRESNAPKQHPIRENPGYVGSFGRAIYKLRIEDHE